MDAAANTAVPVLLERIADFLKLASWRLLFLVPSGDRLLNEDGSCNLETLAALVCAIEKTRCPEEIEYSAKYSDAMYEYRHAILPSGVVHDMVRLVSTRPGLLLTEPEWRKLGVVQSHGWLHYMQYSPDQSILLFRRLLGTNPQTGLAPCKVLTIQCYRKKGDRVHVLCTSNTGEEVCCLDACSDATIPELLEQIASILGLESTTLQFSLPNGDDLSDQQCGKTVSDLARVIHQASDVHNAERFASFV